MELKNSFLLTLFSMMTVIGLNNYKEARAFFFREIDHNRYRKHNY